MRGALCRYFPHWVLGFACGSRSGYIDGASCWYTIGRAHCVFVFIFAVRGCEPQARWLVFCFLAVVHVLNTVEILSQCWGEGALCRYFPHWVLGFACGSRSGYIDGASCWYTIGRAHCVFVFMFAVRGCEPQARWLVFCFSAGVHVLNTVEILSQCWGEGALCRYFPHWVLGFACGSRSGYIDGASCWYTIGRVHCVFVFMFAVRGCEPQVRWLVFCFLAGVHVLNTVEILSQCWGEGK